jgi:sugar phosphate isomerase/epimerase
MMKLGSTTLSLAGWVADPQQPEKSRAYRLAAIRRLVEDYGLSAVELTLDLGVVYPQVFNADFYASVADLQQELGFTCTAHLPFLWIDPASLNEPVRQTSAECLCRAVELVQPLVVSTYVVHLWGLTSAQIAILLLDSALRQAIVGALVAQAGCSLGTLCEILKPQTICVENLEDPVFDLVWPLVERYGVSICLDVGHLAWHGQGELDFLARYGDRIREVHLHDAVRASPDGTTQFRDHLPLGQGEIDCVAFLRKLERLGYDGVVILENNSRADLEESLVCVRQAL